MQSWIRALVFGTATVGVACSGIQTGDGGDGVMAHGTDGGASPDGSSDEAGEAGSADGGGDASPIASPECTPSDGGGRWEILSVSNAFEGRSHSTFAWTGTDLLVFGGGKANVGDAWTIFTDAVRFSLADRAWSPIAPPPMAQMSLMVTITEFLNVWTGQELLVLDRNIEGWRYAVASDTWRPMSVPDIDGSLCWLGDRAIAMDSDGGTALYDPAVNVWTSASSTGAPAPRPYPAVTSIGANLFVWGGGTFDGVAPADGAMYDPVSDAWRAVVSGPLGGRVAPHATWTGSEVLVWGGYIWGVGPVADAARYDPVVNEWRPMSPPPPGIIPQSPTFLDEPRSLWAGSRLIVFGRDEREDAAVYEPATNSWSMLPLCEPDGFSYTMRSSFVWTGSEVLVMGSLSGSAAVARLVPPASWGE